MPCAKNDVVIVNDYAYVNGGTAEVAIQSALGLSRAGHRVFFFSAVGPCCSELKQSAVKVICLSQYDLLSDPWKFRAGVRGLWNFAAARKISSLLDQLDRTNTVVHFHGWTKALTSSAFRVARRKKFPSILTLHDYFSICPNGALYNYKMEKKCPLSPMSAACLKTNCDSRNYRTKLWRVLRQWIQAKFGGIPDQITDCATISAFSRQLVLPHLPKDVHLFDVPNPIAVRKRPIACPEQFNCAVFLGRLSPEKGGELLAKACKAANIKAVFIGEGEEKEKIASLGGEMKGWQSGEAKSKILRSSRVLVVPSLWHETQCLAVLEAAAEGIPAIVPRECAVSEFVEEGVTGRLFSSGCAESLTAEIQRVMQFPEEAARMGRNAYDRFWESPPTLEMHSRALSDAYDIILRKIHFER